MHTDGSGWPVVSSRTRELFRQGAELVLTAGEEEFADLHRAALTGLRSSAASDDPTLFEATRLVNTHNLRRWAAANITNPGERVVPQLSSEAINLARDVVRRGLDGRALDSYRTAQSVGWRRWMEVCFTLTSEAADLQDLLDISSLSISTYLDDTIDELTAVIESDIRDLNQGTNATRMATLTLLLEGAPISRAQAETRFGYRLATEHTAAIIWSAGAGSAEETDTGNVASALEAVADALMRSNNCNRRLTLVASSRSLWVWLPTALLHTTEAFNATLAASPGVRVAIGRGGCHIEGFRRSHLDATAVQTMLARLASTQRVVRYDEAQLPILMTSDLPKADEFVLDTLGGLAGADDELRETVSTYIREMFNTSRTAERMFTHRNTVLRRLARADELLPRPLADNVTNIGAALELVRLRPSAY